MRQFFFQAARCAAFAAGAITLATPAAAAESGALRPGWYLAPMYSVMRFDASRKSGNASGYSIALGFRGSDDWAWLGAEVRADFLESLSYTDRYFVPGSNPGDPPQEERVTGEARVHAAMLMLTAEPLRVLSGLYVGAGIGMVKFDARQPAASPSRDRALRDDAKRNPMEVGLGYRYAFELFGQPLAVRVQATYRLDRDPQDPVSEPDPQKRYSDLLFHAGLQIPLSTPAASPKEAPPTVVPPAFNDADGDGVIDELDTCPDTAAGSVVSRTGCSPGQQPAAHNTPEQAQ